MKPRTSSDQPELSRPIQVDKISAGGVEENIVADKDERKLLAERFDLLELRRLEAKLTVKPARGGRMFEVKGSMKADVIQRCVVTLEPLPAHIAQNLEVIYASPELLEPDAGHSHPALDMKAEETEPIMNGIIDLGELVAQTLGIVLNPYPRKPGVPFVEAEFGGAGEKPNPFAELATLTKSGKDKE